MCHSARIERLPLAAGGRSSPGLLARAVSTLALLASLILAGRGSLAARTITIGGLDAARCGPGALDGIYLEALQTTTRRYLGGIVGNTILLRTSPRLTPEFLASIDLLILSNVRDTSRPMELDLDADEQDALFTAVENGLDAFLLAEGYFLHGLFQASAQALFEPLGVTFVAGKEDVGRRDFDDGHLTESDPPHPAGHGPFEPLAPFRTKNSGWFEDLGPYAIGLATLGFSGEVSLAAIDEGAIGPGSGRVVLAADANPWGGCDVDSQFFLCHNETLLLNILEWLIQPVFCRGDSNADRNVDITDAIHLLQFLFLGGPPPPDPFDGCKTD